MKKSEKFEENLWDTVDKLKRLKMGSSRFQQMLNEHGGVKTAQILLSGKEISDGLIELFRIEKTELSVEHIVLDFEKEELFTIEEINEAKRRLGR